MVSDNSDIKNDAKEFWSKMWDRKQEFLKRCEEEEKPQFCKVRKWWIGLSNREREKIRKEKNIDLVLDLKVLTKLYEDNH